MTARRLVIVLFDPTVPLPPHGGVEPLSRLNGDRDETATAEGPVIYMAGGFSPEDFDIPRWMKEHGYSSVPVGKNFFIVPVNDAKSGGDFVLLGVTIITDDGNGGDGDELTQVIALDQTAASLIAANLSRRVGPVMMGIAMMRVINADMEAAVREGDVSGGFPVLPQVPPSQEVVEQMIKDDLDKGKNTGF